MNELTDSTAILGDRDQLRGRVAEEGYVFFRGLIDRAVLADLRAQILETLAGHGWLAAGSDPSEARPSKPDRREPEPEWWDGYSAIQALEAFHRLGHDPKLVETLACLIGDDVVVQPSKIARVIYPQRPDFTTPPHQDYTHIQGTVDFFTAWIPLSDVPRSTGGLRILRGSAREGIRPLHRTAGGGGGLATDTANDDPRWSTTDYRAGDVLVFHSMTVHAGLPNLSDRLRLSCDYRYQSAFEPVVEQWLRPHMCGIFPVPDWEELTAGWSSTRWAEAPPLEPAAFLSPFRLDDDELETFHETLEVPPSRFVPSPSAS